MPLPAGTRLGAYEILSSLGAGGMGEVYRARDPRLDRDVAIKVLSADLAGDSTALVRFEREATSVAKLSHPNILSIYEFAKADGTAFVVMELVDGETLRARLSTGALPVRRAVGYALQIARGVAAAHGRGIVHRDLKPENVMITRDDQVKILDFGLAKPIDPAGLDQTRGVSMATSAGTVLGTFGYMAPEQVRGLAVDQRADMFAFGAVLYEMLSGQRAFAGETAADSMSAVLTKDPPDLDAAKFAIPPSLDRIVRRCLEKSPDLRFQSANDLAFALDTLSSVSSGASTVSSTPPAPAAVVTSRSKAAIPSWLPWAIAVAAVLVAGAVWLMRGGAAPRAEPSWNTFTRITEAAGEETSPSLSPDGATVAFAVRVNGSWDIYVQRVGGRIATPLVNDPQRDERSPAFSPDGSLIAFHESDIDGGIFIAGATGESVRRLTDFGFEPAWSPDGTSIAFATEEINNPAGRKGNSTLYVVPAAGGTPRKVVDGDGVQPHFSPVGDRLVYWSNTSGQRDIFTVPVAGGERVPLTNDAAIDWSPIWSPDGRFIYFSSDRGGAMNLWRIAVDTAGRAVGAPEPMTSGVQATASLPSLSKDGTRIAFRSRVASTNPVAIPFDPVTARAGTPFLLDTANNIRVPSDVSPDGKQLAYFSIGERQEDLFVGPIGGPMRRVTDDVPRDRAPVFTPDGRSLVFYSTRDGAWALWMIGVDGGNPRKIVGGSAGTIYPLISPKGDTIVFTGAQDHRSGTVPFGSAGATATALPGVDVGGKYFQPTGWSPDGTRLAGTMEAESGRVSGVAIYDLSSHATTLVSSDDTAWVHWLPDNRRVVYFAKNGRELVVVDTATRARMVVDVRLPGPSLDETFTMSRDGRTIYYGAVRAEADIWIMERK